MSFQVIKSQFLDVEIMLHISTKDICETSYYLYCHLERAHMRNIDTLNNLKKINLPWIAGYIFVILLAVILQRIDLLIEFIS